MTLGDTSLAAALAVLSGGLDDPDLDVQHSLDQLASAVQGAVASYCGLSITVAADGIPVTITVPHGDGGGSPAADAVTSLVIPLSVISLTAQGELVLFASAPGAFIDLAADLAYETATELVTFGLDTRLGPPVALTVGVTALSVFNQAVGILVEAGHTPDQARARIAAIAAGDGHNLAAAAERILNGEAI